MESEIILIVENISCPGCAMDMENIIMGMSGVEEASINYTEGVFTIRYDPGEIEAKTIAKKVAKLGFKTKLISG